MDRTRAEKDARDGVVVGMKALTGKILPRYDIDVFLCKYPDTFNLMLLAIAEMQQDNGLLGFFQLAGIHGLPTGDWDSVGKDYADENRGYCAHGVLIFPTWHRPYISLFEQTIYLRMVAIAERYHEEHRERYLDAAKHFRLPYFDYYRPRDYRVEFPGHGKDGKTSFDYNFRLPDVFNEETITICRVPDNEPKEISNPLYNYKFTEKGGYFSADIDIDGVSAFPHGQTVRHPQTIKSKKHDAGALSDTLNSGREGGASMFLDIINSGPYSRLGTVATDKPEKELPQDNNKPDDPPPDGPKVKPRRELATGDMTDVFDVEERSAKNETGSGSLEGTIHGNMHESIGGAGTTIDGKQGVMGQMNDPRVAAFDPIFWFHHCNVDRAWALWQAIHPQSWFPETRDKDGNLESEKPLLPFYKSKKKSGDGTFWNSDDTRETEVFGYYYDDFEFFGTKLQSFEQEQQDKLWNSLLNKYRWGIRTPLDREFRDPPRYMMPLDIKSTQFFGGTNCDGGLVEITQADAEKPAYEADEIDPRFDREWFVDSSVNRSAANGIFTVFFFLADEGVVSHDPVEYEKSPYLAGKNHIFTAARETCSNCLNLSLAGQKASDTTPLTGLLLDFVRKQGDDHNGDEYKPQLKDLTPRHVVPFLAKYLRWRVKYGDGRDVDPREVPGFHIGVSAKRITPDRRVYESYTSLFKFIKRFSR